MKSSESSTDSRSHVFDRHPLPGVEGGVEGGEAEYGRRAYPHAGDAGAGAVVEVEGEGSFVAEPPAEGGPHPLDVPGGDVDKGRRAGSPVQELVGAADREVGPGHFEVDRERARGMREVPYRERAGRVRGSRQARHVVKAPGAVVHLGQHQHRDTLVQGLGDCFRRYQTQLVAAAEGVHEALGHVEVGREVTVVGEDDLPPGPELERGGERLVHLDGKRVAHHHRAGRRANEAADPVADARRCVHPARLAPAPNQHLAPLVAEQAGDAIARRERQGAERVAVEIDDPLREVEEGFGACEVGHRRGRRASRAPTAS